MYRLATSIDTKIVFCDTRVFSIKLMKSLPHRKILRHNKIVLDDIDLRSPARLTQLTGTYALMPLDIS